MKLVEQIKQSKIIKQLKHIKRTSIVLTSFIVIFLFLSTIFLLMSRIPEAIFPDNYSTIVLDENEQYLRIFLNRDQQWIFPDEGKEIPERLKLAVTHFEDKRFEKHRGIDILALSRALYQNIRNKEKISGASTISMQLARLMEPKERTIKNKILEMMQAIRIEMNYSKNDILNLYLLHAPYGSNIIGYRTASMKYFAKDAENLTWAEAATLAVLPNNPSNVNPMQNPERLKKKRDELLLSLHKANEIDESTYRLAIAEEVPEGQYPFPLSAPHLAERLRRSQSENIIRTTINKELQDKARYLLLDHLTSINRLGINNGALLITDTESGEVKAYLASHDYYDNENLGKIDGVQMRRSSGSTLKPFLYALAMDEGLIIQESRIKDIPINYGGYTPHNANRRFDGIVKADEALIRSLNAPAVNLLYQYSVNKFYNFLEEAGSKSLFREAEDYGLSIILGGSETSLWELSQLYRGLGNYGDFSDISVLKDLEVEDIDLVSELSSTCTNQLISAGSAYLVLDILKEVKRPGLEYYWREYQSSSPIAWKTGTSFGSRDAWAVGVSPDWTIAVWVGNFAGGEIKGMTGVDSAAPLLFTVFNHLEKKNSWFKKPEYDLKEIKVSSNTSYTLKGDFAELEFRLASASAKPLVNSPYEQILYLNNEESMQVCSLCWDREDLKIVQRVVYPPRVNKYLRNSGRDYSLVPHNPECPGLEQNNPIDFVYPQEGSRIFLPRDRDGEYQKLNLELAHAHQESRIFWYINDEYLGETINEHQQNIILETGRHKLYVIDGSGNTREINFHLQRR